MNEALTSCGWPLVWVCSGVACIGCWVITRLSIPLLGELRAIDVPGPRSSHDFPTPRGGGVSLAAAWLLAIAFWIPFCGPLGTRWFGVGWQFWLGLLIVFLAGVLDDFLGGVPIRFRLLSQILAALLLVSRTGGIDTLSWLGSTAVEPGWLAQVTAVVWVVGVINFYNFLDGIDGYAAVQGVIAGAGIALVSGRIDLSLLALAAAGACLGFLPNNWHRAKVFLGDSGSSFLGYLFAAIPLLAPRAERTVLVLLTALFLWFFLADGAFTLIRRTFRRERVWEAHRSHIYQRLVQTGLRHDQVVLSIGVMMTVVSSVAVVAMAFDSQRILLLSMISAVLLFLVLVAWVHRRESRVTTGPDSSNDG